jgi:7-cyano-7-deazaguanine synthase in queuosine biosynthesis
MKIQTLDKEVIIEVPQSGKVYVSASGGADSSLLMYLIAKEIVDINSTATIIAFNVPTTHDDAAKHLADVTTWIYDKTGVEIETLYAKEGETILTGNIRMVNNNVATVYFSGQNNFSPEMRDWPEYEEQKSPRLDKEKVKSSKGLFPFIDLYKNHIMRIYKDYDAMELLSLTHSCIAERDFHCQQCLWCKERLWGLLYS